MQECVFEIFFQVFWRDPFTDVMQYQKNAYFYIVKKTTRASIETYAEA